MRVRRWLLDGSVPASSAVKATAAKYEQDDEDDQQCGAIHGSLLRETEPANVARIERAVMISTLLSSHLVPLFAEILFDRLHFLDASSFIATKAARAAA